MFNPCRRAPPAERAPKTFFLLPLLLAAVPLASAFGAATARPARAAPPPTAAASALAAPVTGELLVEAERLAAGQNVRLGVQLRVAPGWHIYGEVPGDAGLATQVTLQSGDATFGRLRWPVPETFHENDQVTTYGYRTQVMVTAPMQLQDSVAGSLTATASVRYLACNVTCSPGQLSLRRTWEVGATAGAPGPVVQAAFAAADAGRGDETTGGGGGLQASPVAGAASDLVALLRLLLAAFVGGVVLNAMPCVLPVLALKAVSLAQVGRRPAEARRHGVAYALGVVASLELLAAGVLLLQHLGHEVGWGFQFQEPIFVAGVAVALVVFAANCLGAFELMPDVGGLAAAHERAHGVRRSALEGVLAVLVATPCSAPFLGTAVAFALGQGPGWVVATFAAIGLGLAAPYVLLVCWPASRRLLPRPGPWMLGLKVALGYALLATAAWLTWVLARAQGTNAMAALLSWAWCAAVGASLLGAVLQRLPQYGTAGLACLVAALVAVGGQLWPWLQDDPQASAAAQAGQSAPYAEDAVARGLAAGRPVFVDFTADWCVTCQYNERHVLADARVLAAFARHRVLVLRADWTRKDDAILRTLQANGRAGVPMYLLYQPGAPAPKLLPEVLTVAGLLRALDAP